MDLLDRLTSTVRSCVKIALQTRRIKWFPQAPEGSRLLVLGNGPSLRGLLDGGLAETPGLDMMAVNFMANTEEYFALRPRYYVMADPHFFTSLTDRNVSKLLDNLRTRVDWPVTLFVPMSVRKSVAIGNPNISIVGYNCVGIEGPQAFCHTFFGWRRGMPRPRNVLIPSLMIGLWMGYKTIYVAGADHSWMRTLEVNEVNEVVSVQPHFYSEDEHEKSRVTSVYKGVRLHEVIHSFYVAFKAYFEINDYARGIGAQIYNITPGSFIDAFERRSPDEILY